VHGLEDLTAALTRLQDDQGDIIMRLYTVAPFYLLRVNLSVEDSEEDSEENGSDGGNSEDGSDAPQPRRKTRRQWPVDMIRDARTLFKFTEEQRTCADTLWGALDSNDRGAQMGALLASISSFIFVKYHPVTLCTGLVQFLAVLGINPR
jgi:hypothetical protein